MPASYPSVASASGTTLAVTASVPDTHDASGFAALSYTTIGKVLSSNLPRRTRTSNVKKYLDGTTGRVFGAQEMPEVPVQVTWNSNDAGVTIVRNNDDGATRLFFKWTLPSGDKVYCAGYVTSFGINIDDVEDDVKGEWTIIPEFDATGTGEILQTA